MNLLNIILTTFKSIPNFFPLLKTVLIRNLQKENQSMLIQAITIEEMKKRN